MSRREAIPLEGELNCWSREFDVPDIIFSVCGREETGLLRFVAREAEKTLFIQEGQIVFASSSSPDDRLGEYLLRTGRMRLKTLTELSKEIRPGRRLGKLLVTHGVLKQVDLGRAVIEQVEAMVKSLFRWTEGWYGFTAQALPGPETITLEKPTVKLILEGMREIESWRRIRAGVSSLTTAYELAPDQEDTIRSLDLDAQALGLLATLRRSQTVEAICASSELHDFEVCRLLWVFRSIGLIRPPATDELPLSFSAAEPVSTAAQDPFALAIETPSRIDADGGLAAVPAPPPSDYSYATPKSIAKKLVTDLPFSMAPENFMVESVNEVVEDDSAVDMSEMIIEADGDIPVALTPREPLDGLELPIAETASPTLAETDSMLEEDLAFALGHEDYSIPLQFGATEAPPLPHPSSSSPRQSAENTENAPFDPDLDLDLEGLGKILGKKR